MREAIAYNAGRCTKNPQTEMANRSPNGRRFMSNWRSRHLRIKSGNGIFTGHTTAHSPQKVAAFGKVRLPDITAIPDWGWFTIPVAIAAVVFWLLERPRTATGNAA